MQGSRLRPFLLLALIVLFAGALAAQQKGFKVYISVDMEGIAGLVDSSQVSPGEREYAYARRLMIAETNAAIAAAFESGASEVLVNDAHGPQTNLQPDQLDRRARRIDCHAAGQ